VFDFCRGSAAEMIDTEPTLSLFYAKRSTVAVDLCAVKGLDAVVMNASERARMMELCTAIASEQDSEKMIRLVEELNRLLAMKQDRLDQKREKDI
jgi:hypothetical protein